MTIFIYYAVLFAAQVLDNSLNTAKTILVQRNKPLLAGIALALSNGIYCCITRHVVTSDSYLAILVVAVASGVGCCLTIALNKRLSRDKTYVNVVMSDNREAMQDFRDFLASHHITNVATDSYTRDWEKKTITVTAYAETKAESALIDRYIEESTLKFKRVVQKG